VQSDSATKHVIDDNDARARIQRINEKFDTNVVLQRHAGSRQNGHGHTLGGATTQRDIVTHIGSALLLVILMCLAAVYGTLYFARES